MSYKGQGPLGPYCSNSTTSQQLGLDERLELTVLTYAHPECSLCNRWCSLSSGWNSFSNGEAGWKMLTSCPPTESLEEKTPCPPTLCFWLHKPGVKFLSCQPQSGEGGSGSWFSDILLSVSSFGRYS